MKKNLKLDYGWLEPVAKEIQKRRKKEAKELAKRLKAVLKEFKRMFRPRGIQDRMMLNMMWGNLQDGVVDVAKVYPPEKTRATIRKIIGHLKWILEVEPSA